MHRCAATRLAFALAVLAACTPTGEPPDQDALEPPPFIDALPPDREAPGLAPTNPTCGAIPLQPEGPWQYSGAQLDWVREGWHPRAEYGRPDGIMPVRSPVEIPGYQLWQVQVDRAPRVIQPCFMREGGPDPDRPFNVCVPAWQLVGQATPEARPRTNVQWAQLLGLLDGASAVYPSAAELDRCEIDLPARVRAAVPPLGLQTHAGTIEATFVERVSMGDELTLLVVVRATLDEGRLQVEHHELFAIDHGVMR